MSRARHSKKKVIYSGAGSNVVKEAMQKKGGGAACKDMGKVSGGKSGKRMDRRARGGRTGADKSPYSSAASPSLRSAS